MLLHRIPGRTRRWWLLVVAMGGIATAGVAALLPAVVYLHAPPVVSTTAGLVVLGAGLAVLALTSFRVGWLVVLAGYTWYLPDLGLTDLDPLDGVLARTAFVHLGLLVHAVATSRDDVRRLPVAVAVVAGWLATASAFTGGYRIVLPLAGLLLLAVVATGRPRERSSAWRTAAGVVLGGGLVVEALARLLYGVAAEPTLAWLHALLVASAAVLLAVGLTWPARLATSDLGGTGVDRIEPTLARHLGVDQVTITVPDGHGGWLDVAGRPALPTGHPVRDSAGDVVTTIDGVGANGVIDAEARRLLGLVAANARLRRSIGQHLDDLTTSRRRLLRSQDVARQAFDERLRNGPVARLDDLAARVPAGSRGGVAMVRDRLAELGRGLDPLTPDGSLVRALADLARRSPVPLSLTGLVEPEDDAVARAIWFLCSEAVANAAKHAGGSPVTLVMHAENDAIVVVVSDSGPGGADPRGSGLLGVADRVAAVGGLLDIVSDRGGTTLTARLPRRSVDFLDRV
jgi:signal transduction histidine kinase